MTAEPILLRWPNLGFPCLVRVSNDKYDVSFRVLFAANGLNVDVKPKLEGKLFLQNLNNTRQVLQSKTEKEEIINWDMRTWPDDIQKSLIPLKVIKVDPALKSVWEGQPLYHEWKIWQDCLDNKCWSFNTRPEWIFHHSFHSYTHAYWVTLKIEAKYLDGLRIPQLFNLIQRLEDDSLYHLNFHAVYLHNRNWHDFNFVHATDPHVAWRNDFIKFTANSNIIGKRFVKLETVFPPKYVDTKVNPIGEDFINFNQNFRGLIQYANELHANEEIDFIVMTGDLVDYINIGRRFVSQEIKVPYDNFLLFRDLVTGWKTSRFVQVEHELEVPLFTSLGNHDYRPNEYPLIATYELAILGFTLKDITLPNFGSFGLTEEQARIYENGIKPVGSKYLVGSIPKYGTDGIKHQQSQGHAPPSYRAFINPDLNYRIQLGKNRIVCLDSGTDKDSFDDFMDFIYKATVGGDSFKDLLSGLPDMTGFSSWQIESLIRQLQDVEGTTIITCHAPLVNTRIYPVPHQFRETEHKLVTQDKQRELSIFLWKHIFPNGFPFGLLRIEHPDPDFEPFQHWFEASGFSNQGTEHFYEGGRDPYLGRGVTNEHFSEFMEAITTKAKNRKMVDLILSGHTHHAKEYIVRRAGDQYQFFHDYYIDGTLNGKKPSEFWDTIGYLPSYPDPLSQSNDPKAWWLKHSPLQIQAISCGYNNTDIPDVGVLRIAVKDNTITRIYRDYIHLINEGIKDEFAFVEEVSIIKVTPNEPNPKPYGFAKVGGESHQLNCQYCPTLFQAERQDSKTNTITNRPLSPDHQAYFFVRFGPSFDIHGKQVAKAIDPKSLVVTLTGYSPEGQALNIPVQCQAAEDAHLGRYYWGIFQPQNMWRKNYTLTLEIRATPLLNPSGDDYQIDERYHGLVVSTPIEQDSLENKEPIQVSLGLPTSDSQVEMKFDTPIVLENDISTTTISLDTETSLITPVLDFDLARKYGRQLSLPDSPAAIFPHQTLHDKNDVDRFKVEFQVEFRGENLKSGTFPGGFIKSYPPRIEIETNEIHGGCLRLQIYKTPEDSIPLHDIHQQSGDVFPLYNPQETFKETMTFYLDVKNPDFSRQGKLRYELFIRNIHPNSTIVSRRPRVWLWENYFRGAVGTPINPFPDDPPFSLTYYNPLELVNHIDSYLPIYVQNLEIALPIRDYREQYLAVETQKLGLFAQEMGLSEKAEELLDRVIPVYLKHEMHEAEVSALYHLRKILEPQSRIDKVKQIDQRVAELGAIVRQEMMVSRG